MKKKMFTLYLGYVILFKGLVDILAGTKTDAPTLGEKTPSDILARRFFGSPLDWFLWNDVTLSKLLVACAHITMSVGQLVGPFFFTYSDSLRQAKTFYRPCTTARD